MRNLESRIAKLEQTLPTKAEVHLVWCRIVGVKPEGGPDYGGNLLGATFDDERFVRQPEESDEAFHDRVVGILASRGVSGTIVEDRVFT